MLLLLLCVAQRQLTRYFAPSKITQIGLCMLMSLSIHLPPRLASRRPIWSDMTSVDIITQWREDWSSASVVNHTIVTDPTIRQPGFVLPRRTWSLLNRFRTAQGPCCANLHKWGLAQSPSCDCGQRQTMDHIVDTCPLTKFEGGLNLLHEADDGAVIWLESTATAALAKWNEPEILFLYLCFVTSAKLSMFFYVSSHTGRAKLNSFKCLLLEIFITTKGSCFLCECSLVLSLVICLTAELEYQLQLNTSASVKA